MLPCKNRFFALMTCFILCVFAVQIAWAAQDVWIVDSHAASWTRATDEAYAKITYTQLDENRWQRKDAAAFAETLSKDVPLVIYVPGYTTTMDDLVSIGMCMVRAYGPGRTARTVFWNWPSERVTGGLGNDIRGKIYVAQANAEYLAKFLKSLPADTKVSLVAFSFGTRVACDAVENLKDSMPENLHVRMVLMGAATDYAALGEKYRNADVPKIAEKILVLYNPDDRALHFYPRLYGGRGGPEALGKCGPPRNLILPEFRDRVEGVNVNPYVGPKHQTILHLSTPAFRNRMGTYLFFEDGEKNEE